MKRVFLPLAILSVIAAGMIMTSCSDKQATKEWTLVWEDNFDGSSFDESIWSKIPRGHSDWNDQMDLNDACFEMRNGNLVLKGIVNPNKNRSYQT